MVGSTLLVTRAGLFGQKQQEWQAEDLRTIRLGPSGTEVNDQPINQLHLVPRKGKKVGMLTERDDDELEWIAAVLRRLGRESEADAQLRAPRPDQVAHDSEDAHR